MPAARRRSFVSPPQQRAWRPRLRALIRDAGFADFSAGFDGAAEDQPGAEPFWELEPSPLVVPPDEWSALEAGLRQRARYVNALLVDLYDEQRALQAGILPPEVVLGDPYYRRPCLKLDLETSTPATLLRFDLVKTGEGWCVVRTRANTPIGLSYAVQNRRFMSQEAGELYRRLPEYHSIINFPLQLLDALRRKAPPGAPQGGRNDPGPNIVLLTGGPQDPFYSEHSFLARKMGLPLARGDDLLVLDNRVYFKTIVGLERVDVIYRRLNDAHIDPVVFDTDRETAGVPGLLQCIRAGNVAVANAIGSGIAESRALDAWLPRLMRFYLGEKPLLPAPPTFTCADNDQLEHILENREKLQVLPAHDPRPGSAEAALPPRVLLGKDGLAAEVRGNPWSYVAQPWVTSIPVDPDMRRSPPFQFSAYVLAHGREIAVLPGGVVHLGSELPPSDRVGRTTDAIVLRGEASTACELPPEAAAPDEPAPQALHHPLGSRTAESLFWLGRYLERAETTARMLSIIDDVALEEIPARERRRWLPVWQGLLEATGHSARRITARERPETALSGDLSWRMTLDSRHASSIYSSVVNAVYNARKLRDYVSPEAWSVLRHLHGRLEAFRKQGERLKFPRAKAQTSSAIDAVIGDINAFLSTAERTMLHDAGWQFLQIGLHVERASMTCSGLRHVLGASGDGALSRRESPELSALLRMLGSQDAYRRLYQTRSQPRHAADFFLRQPDAPRSLLFNLIAIQCSLRAIKEETHASATAAPVEEAVARILEKVRSIGVEGTVAIGAFLTGLLSDLDAFHPVLSDHFFSHQARVNEPEPLIVP